MLRKVFPTLAAFLIVFTCMFSETISIQNTSQKHSKINTMFVTRGSSQRLLELRKIVYDDLDFTDQFSIDLKKTKDKITPKIMKKLFNRGTSLLFEFNENENDEITVSVKDTNSSSELFSKAINISKQPILSVGHQLSADLLEALAGDRGVCLTSIVYCKMLSSKHKIVCLADYACKKELVLVKDRGINIAPSWHTRAPILFYSQITKTNNRLLSINVNTGKRNIICSYNGLNMQPSFSKDGKRAVLCLSGGNGNSELYSYSSAMSKKMGKRVFRPLTKNGAHNVSPCMLPNKDIVFCSDYHSSGLPQLYYFHVRDGEAERLTQGSGYRSSPTYNEKANEIVYSRPVDNTFQLFSLSLDDLDNCKEKQLTFSYGNKHEPSVSPDGRYVVFSVDVRKNGKIVQQIAALNLQSRMIRILTHDNIPKSFPRWGR